ncbi:hypothetical protein EDD22DRAFT_907345, partial [Suillus occidentalis]
MTYLAKLTGHPGAVRWAAPELLSGEELAQVLTGKVPWCHLVRDFQISYQVVIEGKMHPRPSNDYVTDQHWNFMTHCWSMTITDRPPAKEAVQFVGSALRTSTNSQSPRLSISGDERSSSTSPQTPTSDDRAPNTSPQTPTSDDQTPNTVPQTPTLPISSDELHSGIARNDYLGDIDARLPVVQDIDSQLDARENDHGVILPAYSSTTHMEPSLTQSNLPRPRPSDFSATYHAYFPVEDDNNNVTPSGRLLPQPANYNNAIHLNWVNPNIQNAWLQYYMQHVLHIQYLHADGSIDNLILKLIHSSDSAREAACLLAYLHRKSTQGVIGFTAPADTRIQSLPVTEGDAFANLCMVSYFLFSGGQGQWQSFLDSACEFSIKVLQRSQVAPDCALRYCSESMRFIIKTSIWFDVLASVTLIRRPKFVELLRALYGFTAVDDDSPELSMMDVMGCENRVVLALAEIADLAVWENECGRAHRFSNLEIVRRGKRIETILKSTNHPDHP